MYSICIFITFYLMDTPYYIFSSLNVNVLENGIKVQKHATNMNRKSVFKGHAIMNSLVHH